MSRLIALITAFFLTAAAEAGPLPHAAGAPAGPGPGCGGGFTAARGDTLYSIARRCETTVTELAQENRLGQPPQLAAGQDLTIPGFARGALTPPDADAPLPPRRPPPPSSARPDRGLPPPPLMVPIMRPDDVGIYHFQAGDTLYSLARWMRTSLAALRAANPDVDPRDIDVGDPIRLPRGAARPEALRARERGQTAAGTAPAPPAPPRIAPPPPPRPRAAPPPPPRPSARPAPPRADDDADKPKPDDDEDGGPTPGGMDDGGPQPDGM